MLKKVNLGLDSLVFNVRPRFLPQSSLRGANVTVFGCLNRGVPLFVPENATLRCESGK